MDHKNPGSLELTPLPKALKRPAPPRPFPSDIDEDISRVDSKKSLRAPVSIQEAPVEASSSLAQRKLRRNGLLFLAALSWSGFLVGWNDGSTGPLLPRIQDEYNVGFAIVSLIFVANCFGYITGAVLNVWLTDRLGLGKIMVIGSLLQLLGYIIISPAPPFPAMIVAYVIVGLGLSMQVAQANGFLGSLKTSMATQLGIYHGAYGLGAFSAPFLSTHFAVMKHWSFHFIISGALQVSNLLVLVTIFRFRHQEAILADAGQDNVVVEGVESTSTQLASDDKFRQMFKLKALHILAAFTIIYVGIEVTLGGWIVTFIIRERGGGPSSGYISSGFFGGLALGRVVLIWFNRKIGEQRVIYLYSLVAIALELTIWFVPSIIQNALAVSIIGMVLGPMFPIIVSHASRILPRRLLTGCVGWISGVGVSGSAGLPFITGLLASKYGIRSLQPLMVSMMGVMVLVWACVPRTVRRSD